MQIPNLEDLIGESEQDHARVLEEEAREEQKQQAEKSLERYEKRKRKRDSHTDNPTWLEKMLREEAARRSKELAEEEMRRYWTGLPSDYYRLHNHIIATPVTTAPLNPKRLPGS